MNEINHINPSSEEVEKAWVRFLNNSCTRNDLALILKTMKDKDFSECDDIFLKEWQLSSIMELLETEESNEAYKVEAAKILIDRKSVV